MLKIRASQLHGFWLDTNAGFVDWCVRRVAAERPELAATDLRSRVEGLLKDGLAAGKQAQAALFAHVQAGLAPSDTSAR